MASDRNEGHAQMQIESCGWLELFTSRMFSKLMAPSAGLYRKGFVIIFYFGSCFALHGSGAH